MERTMLDILYARISDDPQEERCGVKLQRATGYEHLDLRQVPRSDVLYLEDNNIGAWKRRGGKLPFRPDWERGLALLRTGQVRSFTAYNLDRIARDLTTLEQFLDAIDEAGGCDVHLTSQAIDLNTDDGRAMARIMVTMGKKSSDDTSRRITDHLKSKAKEGKAHGKIAFGYQLVLETDARGRMHKRRDLHPFRAPYVREAFELVLQGVTAYGICQRWNEAGLLSMAGKQLGVPQKVEYILQNPTYAGRRHSHGKTTADGLWPAIVDGDTFDRVQAVLAERKRVRGKAPHKAWINSVGVCGVCGTKLRANGERIVCGSNRHCVTTDLGKVQDPAFDIIRAVATHPDVLARVAELNAPNLDLAEIRRLETKLDALETEYWERDAMPEPRYRSIKDKLTADLEALRGEAVPGTIHVPRAFDAAWKEMTVAQRGALAATFLKTVTLNRATLGNRPDPSRVVVELHPWVTELALQLPQLG